MADKEILYYLKNETSSDELYLIAVTCIERLVKQGKASAIKAILDAGTSGLYNMFKNKQ